MTFEEIVSEVCERLNLTSDEAKSRVGREVNSRYKRLTASIGLETSRPTQVSQQATLGDRDLVFSGVEKIYNVVDKSDPNQDIVLTQITNDEMHITPIRTQPPRHYSVKAMGKNSVTVTLDCVPAAPLFTLYADGLANLSTLSGSEAPAFPESYHDILVFGAMADEYRKMEKEQLYMTAEKDYETRLSDLRMFIAKSAYLDIFQGRYSGRVFRWTRDAQLLWDQ